mmetsp:Transcript_39104/g.62444  ORF Transcript_39104/g.62444 Transcript_39104/m.62444 type:complete len:156 (-) Transcript_39104:344-811(-)
MAFSGDALECGSYPCGEDARVYCNAAGYCKCDNGQQSSYPCGVGGDPRCYYSGYCCCATGRGSDEGIEGAANSLYHGNSELGTTNGNEALIGNLYLIILVAMVLFCVCFFSRFYSRCNKPAKSIHDEASNQSQYGSIPCKQADDAGQVDGKATNV